VAAGAVVSVVGVVAGIVRQRYHNVDVYVKVT
jgi:hypothetical protein